MVQTIKHPEQNDVALKTKGVSLAAILDLVRPRVDNTYTTRIRITFNRKSKYYSTKVNFTIKQWDEVCAGKSKREINENKVKVFELLKFANQIILSLESFSFERFENLFLNKKSPWKSVFYAFEDHIETLKEKEQYSTASTYSTAYNSFKTYYLKKDLLFEDVTISFLEDYERWMKNHDKSPTTVSIYVRCLRRLFNLAIIKGDVKREKYPFGSESTNKYEPPQSKNIKKALHISEIEKLFSYETIDKNERFYLDLFLFSYLANGMNMADICLLKYSHIISNEIVFIRKKISTKRKLKPIQVYINEELDEIIQRHGNMPKLSNAYIFPILNEGLSKEKITATIKQNTKQCNKYLKRIATKIGINESITTYYARHSFASTLKMSGESIAFISEALGHSNLQTTENYLASFSSDKRKESQKKLTPWKN